jgi:hypothetical protein
MNGCAHLTAVWRVLFSVSFKRWKRRYRKLRSLWRFGAARGRWWRDFCAGVAAKFAKCNAGLLVRRSPADE